MKYILIFFLLVSCVKDYDLNPYTTVIKHLITGEYYYENGTLPYNHSKQR
jgi:hypothetical protein